MATARDVFIRVGLKGARSRDLADAANINEATLYSHFRSKEDLFFAAIIKPLQDALKGLRETSRAYRMLNNKSERASVNKATMAQLLEQAREIYPLLAVALFSDRDTGTALYRKYLYPLLRERGAILQDSLRKGIDGEIFSIAFFGIAFAFSVDWSFRGQSFDQTELAEQLLRILANSEENSAAAV